MYKTADIQGEHQTFYLHEKAARTRHSKQKHTLAVKGLVLRTNIAFLSGSPGNSHGDIKQPPAAAAWRPRGTRQQLWSTLTHTRMDLATVVQVSRTELRTQANTRSNTRTRQPVPSVHSRCIMYYPKWQGAEYVIYRRHGCTVPFKSAS